MKGTRVEGRDERNETRGTRRERRDERERDERERRERSRERVDTKTQSVCVCVHSLFFVSMLFVHVCVALVGRLVELRLREGERVVEAVASC